MNFELVKEAFSSEIKLSSIILGEYSLKNIHNQLN